MISFVPYYRKDRKAVVIRVFVKGHISKVIDTGIRIEPAQWDGEKKKIVSHPNKNIFNQKIKNKINEVEKEVTKAEILGVVLTSNRVKKLAEGNVVTTNFYDHCKAWIQEKYAKKTTRNQAMTELNKVASFAPNLQFGDIDYRFLTKYEKYMREVLGNESNTPWKGLKFIRTMVYDAERIGGIIHKNPFKLKEFKMPKYIQPVKDGLKIEEIDKLESLLNDPIPEIHKQVIAKFLFMCYTGLRVSDAKRYAEEEHLKDGERIIITSKKTGIRTDLKLHNRLKKILERIRQMPHKSISDKYLNEWLKVIAEMAGIKRLVLTTHVGRHTFGCLLAEAGVSEEEAMELMGVKNKKVVRVYYKLRQPQTDKAADKLNNL